MANLPDFLSLYSQLIEIPTISSTDNPKLDHSNQPLIEKLASWLHDLGFKVDILPIAGSNYKFNLLATYGEGAGGLLLAGHSDTVPFDAGRWQFDPFKLTEKDGRFYGLGSADMKGFFAFIVDTLRNMDLTKLQKPLRILATADEETTMLGARTFVQHAEIRPDCAIIGEPTSLQPVRAHKGHFGDSVTVIGRSGHSSDPEKGVNAIEIMHQATAHLIELRNELKAKFHNDFFAVPYPTMNFGSIHGGDAVNRICGCCELQFDIRPLPNMGLESLDEMVQEKLQPLIEQYGDMIQIKHLHDGIPGYECSHKAEIVAVVEKLLGKPCVSANYCTEAPFIQQLCPTLVLGPGSIEQAHQPDEFLSAEYIQPTKALLEKLIRHFCV
ncbi:acetylornithine deacetylase [Gallibacterium genomosp. 1]|uniref:Acetylornithine deacetylase n=1 Tax=Gallibacterium genomosp. 1 TaxID=155515 RepID=A0AB36E1G5_9PAST|nr:acetylornithine deacetylase [Gallibacterium genomosp. 1]OBX02173.1 acetylornithine deacetylase [Gallibacterium genomosp. 1]OBX03133.1 acetylornithine deacetylase [Gallibacterium genomosp. 1]